MIRTLCLTFFCLLLSSCSFLEGDSQQNHDAICKELKHRIIVNGATTDPTVMTEERASLPSLTQNYRAQGCN